MAEKQKLQALLSGYRVVDLADEKGAFCGKVLGDLGADVIKVEKPGGDPSRNIGPFYHDISKSEKSLFWFAYNSSKRGVTLDIEKADGQTIFKQLVKKSDFVLESFSPGYMESLGLGYASLSEVNPRIILISVTPFGQTGPYSNYKGTDIVAMASGGLMYVCGDPDRPPLRCSVDHAYHQAGVQAAAGALIALYHRESSGEGQWVDVSMQECIARTLLFFPQLWDMNKIIQKREGIWVARGARQIRRRNVFACKDGYIAWQLIPGQWGRRIRALVEWMDNEGMSGDLMEVDWEAVNMDSVTQKDMDYWESAFEKFFLTHTKMEFREESLKRGLMLFPVANPEEFLADNQLAQRDFWIDVEHPELEDTIKYPGSPYKFSEAPATISRRAPLIGEHNEEIYEGELGLNRDQFNILVQSKVI